MSAKLSLCLLVGLTLLGCGGPRASGAPRWSMGEQPRWARFNPCPCLMSERFITSVELRPLDPNEPSTPPPALGLWERVAIERPLSAEARALLLTLRERGEEPVTLLVDIEARQKSIESHTLRVARLIALEPKGEERSDQRSPQEQAPAP